MRQPSPPHAIGKRNREQNPHIGNANQQTERAARGKNDLTSEQTNYFAGEQQDNQAKGWTGTHQPIAHRAMFNANFLFASLIWGSVGVGYFIYGKKQSSWLPMIGGVLMIAVSYFVGSVLLMSLISIGIILAIYVLWKRGY
jgi:hypothetical protein